MPQTEQCLCLSTAKVSIMYMYASVPTCTHMHACTHSHILSHICAHTHTKDCKQEHVACTLSPGPSPSHLIFGILVLANTFRIFCCGMVQSDPHLGSLSSGHVGDWLFLPGHVETLHWWWVTPGTRANGSLLGHDILAFFNPGASSASSPDR